MNISIQQIQNRLNDHLFKDRILDNSFRGFWCEAMVAQALGQRCAIVGDGWFPWDLQIGPLTANFPDRVRVQVKNTARLQPWNLHDGIQSKASFNLTYRNLPKSLRFEERGIPCESRGFLCDAFILCEHPENDPRRANQKDPSQWRFYVLPVRGPNSAVTETEMQYLEGRLAAGSTSASTQRHPRTLAKGIRGRPQIHSIGIAELTLRNLKQALELA
ncbi:hypothetical protein SAMN05444851_2297 [Aliiroseovarius sediminilitoris]|uniref:Uncharacterized protein n=1 Tax=Aliiroseovarius sediminilitoris TaxID=1173584 RepID=A0A1I0Q7K6_9RHOB|nr:hypothetical protein SAMN05444851_2297 [Aliiroseovarius sediminilitoris]